MVKKKVGCFGFFIIILFIKKMRQQQQQQFDVLKNNLKGIIKIFHDQYKEYLDEYRQLRQHFSSQSRSTMIDLYHKTLDLKEELNRFLILLETPNIQTRFRPPLQQLRSYLTPETRGRHANFLENFRERNVATLYGSANHLNRRILRLLQPSS
jgi:hypothetical protein